MSGNLDGLRRLLELSIGGDGDVVNRLIPLVVGVGDNFERHDGTSGSAEQYENLLEREASLTKLAANYVTDEDGRSRPSI